MTKIKFCGLIRTCDIDAANELRPEYVGFVFAPKSKRYVTPERAAELKRQLAAGIKAVGVFVNDDLYHVAELLNRGIIDIAQLHGSEDEEYIGHLRQLTGKSIIRAYRIKTAEDIAEAEKCTADHVLLDSGAGTGEVFDWKLIKNMKRPYFLAGGLSPDNVENAVEQLSPYAVDVSSGIETDGVKDKAKMAAFAAAVRGEKI
jgi:phosphoribosylanthranilate isomerase